MKIRSGWRSVAVVLCALGVIVFANCGNAAADNAQPPASAEAVEAISAYYLADYADDYAYNRGEQRTWNIQVVNVDVIPDVVSTLRGMGWPVRADVTITGTIPSTGVVDTNDSRGRSSHTIFLVTPDDSAGSTTKWRVTPAPDDGEYAPIE